MPSLTPDARSYGSDGDEETIALLPRQIYTHTASSVPDDSPLLAELTSEEFPRYFSERGGRLFHSHGSSPYPLPADTPEQQLRTHSGLTFRRFGTIARASETCPRPVHGDREMFEVHDVNSPYRWRTGSIDLVHARSVSMAVLDFSAILREVARILRPGGLFISCEWGRYPAFHPSLALEPTEHTPGACQFFDTLTRALDVCRGIQPIAGSIPGVISGEGNFRDVTQRCYYMPIGPWHADPEMKELGRAYRAALIRYVDSVKPLLAEAGLTHEQVGTLVHGYLHELRTVRGMVSVLHTVHARRV
ncbi:hypothetical protein DXG01_003562 [Tephrocybe rancida]|nr:hypothetical protein DXG01_003562 [Tephrocybe rancida]